MWQGVAVDTKWGALYTHIPLCLRWSQAWAAQVDIRILRIRRVTVPIEQLSPELERIVSRDQEIEELGSGIGTGEGPVWHREGGYLLFSDVRNNRIMKWAPREGISVFRDPSNYSIGLCRDPQGRLIVCEGRGTTNLGQKGDPPSGRPRMTRIESDGSITVVANNYRGWRLNRPNDVAVKSDGSIYFNDGGGPDLLMDLDFSGVYRVSPDLGTITLLVRDFVLPNGIEFSPDESILYIADSRRMHIRAFDVQHNGTLALATDRVFCNMKGERPGISDGMTVDSEGNVYATGPGGVWIIDPLGNHLGTILTGSQQTTSCAWGGEDWKTLFMTTRESLARIQLKVAGMPVPR